MVYAKKVHTVRIIILTIFTFLFSCKSPKSSHIEFDGRKFELPSNVKIAKENLGLWYEYYTGFFFGNVNDKSIQTQIKGYPQFLGSDNDKEESYYDKVIVGITFFKADKTIEQFKKKFAKLYNKKFKTVIKNFRLNNTLTPFNLTFHYIETNEGLFIALKELDRKPDYKKYISISFYNGISENELEKYLEYVR
jgi:hypothetical protein